eukprot:CAMPEP_0194214266 /NCGR_PEP_ID=MMETSP0156-20130528/15456_1 /TAXON_ID=33649 /ORGANISM="Thalassionema nitzschioides, Strain L26-B" /LENGTH=233 /DNA_ID=CAMNT_0038942495 /DNA_START=61 /DNA_END=762 /DNA_ORIENTATION=+
MASIEKNGVQIRRIYRSEEDNTKNDISHDFEFEATLSVALHITKGAFLQHDLDKLESLRNKLPLDLSRPTCPRRFVTEKMNAEQLHQHQEDGWIGTLLNKTIQERWNLPFQCLPWYRFLEYKTAGGCMTKHSDGTNTHENVRSVATMLLYLSTCGSGGETTLYKRKNKEKRKKNRDIHCKHADGYNEETDDILESIRPMYNTVLIFPHGWQHSGDTVTANNPKIVLRVDLARI